MTRFFGGRRCEKRQGGPTFGNNGLSAVTRSCTNDPGGYEGKYVADATAKRAAIRAAMNSSTQLNHTSLAAILRDFRSNELKSL